MAEGVVDGFERILGMAIGFRLGEADIGQLTLDDVEQRAVRRFRAAAVSGKRGKARLLVFEVAKDVLQPVLDPSEVADPVVGGDSSRSSR